MIAAGDLTPCARSLSAVFECKNKEERMRNGIVFYEGNSELNGEPILGIATGLVRPSTNQKTGDLIQTWVIPSVHPWEAIQTGADDAVCGDCRHRGHLEITDTGTTKNIGRSCYVTVSHTPANVWRSHRKGLYESVTPVMAQRLFARRKVRLGAYGDIAAIPSEIVAVIVAKAEVVLGYTHAWRDRPELARWCMASVDSEGERDEARALGFRTFRVRGREEPPLAGEGACPASSEMGRSTRCSECGLCSGLEGKGRGDVTIRAHGSGVRHFEDGRTLAAAAA